MGTDKPPCPVLSAQTQVTFSPPAALQSLPPRGSISGQSCFWLSVLVFSGLQRLLPVTLLSGPGSCLCSWRSATAQGPTETNHRVSAGSVGEVYLFFAGVFFFSFFFFWLLGIWYLSSLTCRSNLRPLHWKCRVLTPGPPGTSLQGRVCIEM